MQRLNRDRTNEKKINNECSFHICKLDKNVLTRLR